MVDLIRAKIVRLRSKDGLYQLHETMLGTEFWTRPFSFEANVRHYKEPPWLLRRFIKPREVMVKRLMVSVEPDGGAYPEELVEFLA